MTRVIRTNWCTIGVLYPGDMGSSLGRLLIERGFHVVTTLDGRGSRTARLCQEAGIEVIGSLTKVIRRCDVVISLVTPSSALDVADHFCDCVHLADRRPVYVDANSISPDTARAMGRLVTQSRCQFVDASIHGLASRLGTMGTMYLSGAMGQELAALLSPVLKTRYLGKTTGAASALKMVLAGMSKSLVAVFFEMAVAAKELGLLDELLAGYREYYPGIMTALDRMVPTYPRHAARRGGELAELEQTIGSLGLLPHLSRGAREIIARVGRLPFDRLRTPDDSASWSLLEVVEAIHQLGGLHDEGASPGAGAASDSAPNSLMSLSSV